MSKRTVALITTLEPNSLFISAGPPLFPVDIPRQINNYGNKAAKLVIKTGKYGYTLTVTTRFKKD